MIKKSNRKTHTQSRLLHNNQLPIPNDSTNEDKCEQMFEYANFIFEQVKFQQEARDNWFGHYLTIVSSVVGFATIIFAVFSESWKITILEIALGGIFILTGLLGVFFYLLFLSQRVNYKLHYRVLNELQHYFASRFLKEPYSNYYPSKRTPFKKLTFGADFYASLIQRFLVSFCSMSGTALIMLGFGNSICHTIIFSVISFCLVLAILTIIHKMYEKTV